MDYISIRVYMLVEEKGKMDVKYPRMWKNSKHENNVLRLLFDVFL